MTTLAAEPLTRHYHLGPVKPWVQFAGNQIGTMFDVATEYGVAAREGDSDHPLGLAIDFMVYGDSMKGDQIAAYAQSTYKQLNIHYIIWQQKIWNWQRASEGWRLMPDRGSATANHLDHVHISFNATNGGVPGFPNHDPAPDTPWNKGLSTLGGIGDVITWAGNPHNWYRIFLVLAGAALLAFALWKFDSVQSATQSVAAIAGKVK